MFYGQRPLTRSISHLKILCRHQCSLPSITVLPKEQTHANSSSNLIPPDPDNWRGLNRLQWTHSPRNIFIVAKQNDKKVARATIEFISHIQRKYPDINIVIEPHCIEYTKKLDSTRNIYQADIIDDVHQYIECIITLGGDGTILKASSYFSQTMMPPVLSFSLGTLGYMLPYNFDSYASAFKEMMNSKSKLLYRSRLLSVFKDNVLKKHLSMNEVTLHRGAEPHLASLDIYVDNEFLTKTVADGLIIGTPTGSTAYNLSAGGSIIHPGVQCLSITPICPQSLSFRPILVPDSCTLTVTASKTSRASIDVSVDGMRAQKLSRGNSVEISVSKTLCIPCVRPDNYSSRWIKDLNQLLGWNHRFGSTE